MRSVLVLVLVPVLGFQQAQITNGTVVPAASSSIEREVAAAAGRPEPSWVAWKVPAAGGHSRSCCWYSNNGDNWYGCGLEPRKEDAPPVRPPQPAGPVPLEGGTKVLVMARVAGGAVERVRSFSDDCPLDAGGRAVHVIDGVTAEASVRWLATRIEDEIENAAESGKHNNEIAAIAATAGPAADAALNALAASSQPSKVRQRAIFWIGQSRGDAGFRTLKTMLEREDDARVRRSIIQAISHSESAEAVPALIAIAKTDKDPAARGEAVFWLAQRAGKSVATEITDAARNDPDAKVQERAVMALSQLPANEGVPLLIDVARTHQNARVRRRAMFWLGQSKDPRAVKFFEEILLK